MPTRYEATRPADIWEMADIWGDRLFIFEV